MLAIPSARTIEPAAGKRPATGEDVKAALGGVAETRVKESYGQLPVAFEENAGQLDGKVKYSARGSGFQLFLTSDEAVLSLNKPAIENRRDEEPPARTEATEPERAARSGDVLRMKLVGANRRARVKGEARLAAHSNYFIGAKPERWQARVAMFEKVRYAEVYPGVDIVYYGNQRQLEYDFILAPHVNPARIKFKFSGARQVRLDAEGHLSLQTDGGYVRQEKPVIYQLVDGRRQEIAGRYAINESGEIGFDVGQYDRSQPLVIDPVLSYSTYLGGTDNDQALGITIDGQGNAYITGHTASTDFPTATPYQAAKNVDTDVFVLKLNPGGNSLVYATYLGGNGTDRGHGIAVDAAGNAYVTGLTFSNNFPRTFGTVQDNSTGHGDGFVTKLNAAGNGLAYSSYLGGENFDEGYAIAVDAAGNAYVTGSTDSIRFLNRLDMPKQGSPIYKSGDAGATWSPRKTGLLEVNIASITVDPTNSGILYAAASTGVYKSFNGGGFWNETGQGSSTTPTSATSVAVDPSAPMTLYASTFGGVYKSTNGGDNWNSSSVGLGNLAGFVYTVTIDPTNSSTLYAGTADRVYKSINAGASWVRVSNGFAQNVTRVSKIIFDPTDSKILYAATNVGVYKSLNGATGWSAVNNGLLSTSGVTPPVSSLAISPASPATVYAGTSVGVFKSTDGGLNWVSANDGLRVQTNSGTLYIPPITAVVISPAVPTTIYASSWQGGVFKSTDGGANWAASNNGLANIYVTNLAIDPTAAATLYASANTYSDAFVIKLNANATDIGYLRYLGGNEYDEARGIALDAGGNAYLTGETRSTNFQTVNPLQANGGGVVSDAFVTKLGTDGSTLYATYLGGGGEDIGLGIAVSPAGNAHVTGSTTSTNFPTAGSRQTSNASGTEAFVSKLSVSGSSLDYSVYHGGHSVDQGNGIALDAAGNAYVTGTTLSSNFPHINGVQAGYGGGSDVFVLKLSPTSDIIYSTYVGGSGNEDGFGIAADGGGSAYIAGRTTSFNFPTASPLQATQRGSLDAFIAKISNSVDLSVTMTDAPDPVVLGGDLTYTIKVANAGELPATGVRLSDTLPAGSSLVSATASTGTCSGTSTVICELGNFTGGASATVTLVVKPPVVRTMTNTASASANEPEVNTANNTATQQTLVDYAELSVTAGAIQGIVTAGGRLTYVLAVSNNGVATATNVNVTVGLPAGLTIVSCTAPGGSCAGTGNSRTATFPTLAVNASQPFIIVADVNGGLAEGTVLSITADASSSLPDPVASNNGATASVTVSSTAVQPKSNGKIAFTVLFDGVFVMNDDGTNITKIYTEAGGSFYLATWSPDGTKLAFIKEKSSALQLCVINADGSQPRVLSPIATLDARPTWSPSGAFVGFISRERNSVRIVNATGTPSETTLFNTSLILSDVSWSPDGSKLLYSTANAELWTVNLDGSNQKLLDTDPNTADTMPDWSRDGTKIIFLRRFVNTQSGDVSIYTMNADGTNAQPLPNPVRGTSSLKRPVFSPDGTMIAYEAPVSINGNNFLAQGVHKVNADGTNIRRVPSDGHGGSAPSWQPLPASGTPPAPAPTFRISGRVTPPSGVSASYFRSFARIELTGSRTASAFPDENGNYSFTLPAGGNYTVTPAVNPVFNFSPGSYTFNNLSADQTGANFTSTLINISISGRVTRVGGMPLKNIVINLTRPGFPTRTEVTAADGSYAFNNLEYNSTYSVSVSSGSRTHHTFTPDAAPFFLLGESKVVNFVGAPVRQFEFSAESFNAGEGQGRGTVSIARIGDASGAASVQVRTYDIPEPIPCDPLLKRPDGSNYPRGTAYARCDYATTVETITWAAGDTQAKHLEIPLIDDAYAEGTEHLTLVLGEPQGGIIGAPDFARLIIQDNDATAGANPIYTTPFFVRMQYLDFLSREPEEGEPWSRVLDKCPNVNNDVTCDRILVSQSFFGSPEFRLKGFYVFNFYRVAFNRIPTYEEIIPDMRSVSGATAAEVYQKRAAFAVNFAARPEFAALYNALSDTAFVNTLLDRYALQQITTPDPQNPEGGTKVTLARTELATRLGASGAQALTRAQALRAVVESDEVGALEYNRAFVAMQYYGYLRRTPEDGGYQAWLRVINEDPQNIRIMVNGFMNSPEYRLRFGQQ